MQVVDTNRSKASFKRLKNKHLKEASGAKAKLAKNKKETKRSIVGQHFESDFVQLSGCNPQGLNPGSKDRKQECGKSKRVEDPYRW